MTEFALNQLERYVERILHQPVRSRHLPGSERLPNFISRLYRLYEIQIAGQPCIVLIAGKKASTPAEVAKHAQLVRSAFGLPVIFVSNSVSSTFRARLIDQATSFIVPDNQLYLPELAMDLRERFRSPRIQELKRLAPVAQAVLFHHLLKLNPSATTPTTIASCLRYSPMSTSRAMNDLKAAGLAELEWLGKEKHLKFRLAGRELFEAARKFLRSPVQKTRYTSALLSPPSFQLSGESALSRFTDLAAPQIKTYAVFNADWRSAQERLNLPETDVVMSDADVAIETWLYNPLRLSRGPIVDKLSLYTEFLGHRDERVVMAADALLEQFQW